MSVCWVAIAAACACRRQPPRSLKSPLSFPTPHAQQVRARPRLATGAALQWAQMVALCRKHAIVRRRAWRTNLLLVAQAALFVCLIWAVDRAVTASNQRKPSFSSAATAEAAPVGAVPDCAGSLFMRAGQPCYTLLYAPAVSTGSACPAQRAVGEGEAPASRSPLTPPLCSVPPPRRATPRWRRSSQACGAATTRPSPPHTCWAWPMPLPWTPGCCSTRRRCAWLASA